MERNPTTVPYMLEVHKRKLVTGHSQLKGFYCVNPSDTEVAGWVPDLSSDGAILVFMLFKDHYNESGHMTFFVPVLKG